MMYSERYSIEVGDDCVKIHGHLTMREAFDFLSFFDQQGYTCVIPGDQNSAIFLTKKNYSEESHKQEEKSNETFSREEYFETCYEEEKHEKEMYKSLYEKSLEQINYFKETISDLEKLLNYYRCEIYERNSNIRNFPFPCF